MKRLFTSRLLKLSVVATALTLLFNSQASCANDDVSSNTAANIDTYDERFFTPFSPQNLRDILEKIPGANNLLLAMNNNNETRGFGSSGEQILINRQRVSGKGNSIKSEIDNIQAKDVDYIELIRGSVSGLDVQSNGLIINVMLKDDISTAVLWNIGVTKTDSMQGKALGSLVLSGGEGDLTYRFGFERQLYPTKVKINELFSSADNEPTKHYKRVRKNWFREDIFSNKLSYKHANNTSMTLNSMYKKIYLDSDFDSTYIQLADNTTTADNLTFDWGMREWEIGGDINHKINDKHSLKLLFIENRSKANDQLWQTIINDNDSATAGYQLPRLYRESESVVRGSWKYTLNQQHSFDSGVELAINKLDENLQFIDNQDDVYHSTELNGIKETRYEGFSHYNYSISQATNLQASVVYEYSKLDVTTDFSLQTDTFEQATSGSTRSFNYLKPRINLRHDVSDAIQLRTNLERTVSQLNLNDFVPSFNREEQRLEETNPNLRPEIRDELSVSFERQWQATSGSLTLTPYYHKITDLIVEIPLVSYSGEGNIDSAKEYGIELETDFGLDVIGLPNTMVSASYTWRDSNMRDPFTGQDNKIARLSDNEWQVKINQTGPIENLDWSMTLQDRGTSPFTRFDYTSTLEYKLWASMELNYKLPSNLKLTLKGDRLLSRKTRNIRTRHTGLFTENGISQYEDRRFERSPRFTLLLSGQF